MRLDKRWIWIFLAFITLVIRWALSPEQIEHWYSRGLFPLIRQSIDIVNKWMPIPMFYLLALILTVGMVAGISRWWGTKEVWYKKAGNGLLSLSSVIAALFFFFTWMWGFNYGRISLEDQLELDISPMEDSLILPRLDALTQSLSLDRVSIPKADTNTLSKEFLPADYEDLIRADLEVLLTELGYPVKGSVRGRLLLPKGILLRFGSAGVYLPWTGEGHIDKGLHPIQWPFTIAHEMAHGYGITDEGSCNFLGYLACIRSDDPFVRYSGRLAYWRYLAREYRVRVEEEVYADWIRSIPTGMRADLNAIYDRLEAYPDLMPMFRDLIYDNYLKAQGISEGLRNYNRIVLLVHAWEQHEVILEEE